MRGVGASPPGSPLATAKGDRSEAMLSTLRLTASPCGQLFSSLVGEPRPLNQSPFGQTGETSPSRDKLCLGGGPHADGACHCCSCVHRVRIDRGRTRLVRVPAADGQRTSSVTSGRQLAVLVALRSAPRRERLRDRMKLFAAVHESGYVHEAASS